MNYRFVMEKGNSTLINFRNSDFDVLREINLDIYSCIKSDSVETLRHTDDPIIEFFVSNRELFLSREIIDFLNSTGIDWRKGNEIFHYPINELIALEGWYDVVGRIREKERVDSIIWSGDFFTTNIFFENNIRHGLCPEFEIYSTFRMDFTILIPKEHLLRPSS